jgi:uncharacterized protein YndB with AHSA1/START domain
MEKESKTTTDQTPLIVDRIYQAPVAEVWAALTDPDHLKHWYFDIPEFVPVVGAKFQFTGENEGRVYVHLCTVTEVIINKKLQYTWVYKDHGGNSLVTFELFPMGERTRIVLTHEGLHTFPQIQDFRRENFQEGWIEIIGRMLKDYVEKKSK